VPRRGRVVYLDAVPVASKHGRDPQERGPRSHHRMARKALLRRGVGASRLSAAAEGPPPP
ncbi:MAG: hypothetical protein ACREX8_18170, partial [Gammaproteobacteria bacterium]